MKDAVFGLLGNPLGHSFSQVFFTNKFEKQGINAQYQNFAFDKIANGVEALQSLPNLCGFNVTIPYKESIIPSLKTVSKAAKTIGAVNTVIVLPNGHWHGENTDHIGFVSTLKPYVAKIDKALILGTGGSSKAVAYALQQLGISFQKVSRFPEGTDIAYEQLSPRFMTDFQLIVNCTPLGMKGASESKSPLEPALILPEHLVFDLVYNPFPTPLLSTSQNPENLGLVMLEEQALAAWQLWQANPKYLSFQK